MPAHTHAENSAAVAYYNSTAHNALNTARGPYTTVASGGALSTGSAGSGAAVNNMPAYQTFYAWRRVA